MAEFVVMVAVSAAIAVALQLAFGIEIGAGFILGMLIVFAARFGLWMWHTRGRSDRL